MRKCLLGLSYFFFWIVDWWASIQTNDWIALPSSDTSDPSVKAIELTIWVTLATSIALGVGFCFAGRGLSHNKKIAKSWSFWINAATAGLMLIYLMLCGFNLSIGFNNTLITILVTFISLFTVALGVFDFYKLLRSWNFEWYAYGITLQGLAITMIFLTFSSMC